MSYSLNNSINNLDQQSYTDNRDDLQDNQPIANTADQQQRLDSSHYQQATSQYKRNNFQFTYYSENCLLSLIFIHRQDIFTRGNKIKTWNIVLQKFNERINTNIIQSRTINQKFQSIKKNLINKLIHEKAPFLKLNENEKLMFQILEYMHKNNYSSIDPYNLNSNLNSTIGASTSINDDHSSITDLNTGQIETTMSESYVQDEIPHTSAYYQNNEFDQNLTNTLNNLENSASKLLSTSTEDASMHNFQTSSQDQLNNPKIDPFQSNIDLNSQSYFKPEAGHQHLASSNEQNYYYRPTTPKETNLSNTLLSQLLSISNQQQLQLNLILDEVKQLKSEMKDKLDEILDHINYPGNNTISSDTKDETK